MNAEYELSDRGNDSFPFEYYYLDPFHSRYVMPYHWHMDYELVRMIKGRLVIHVGNARYELTDGDCVFVSPGAIHGTLPPEGIYECVVFDVTKLFYNGSTNFKALGEFWDTRNGEPIMIKSDAAEIGYVESFFHAVKAVDSPNAARLLTAVGAMMSLMGAHYGEKPRSFPAQKEKTERIKNVITYIRKNYATHVTLDDLAEAVGVNREYLCREFKTTIGMSPINFLIDYRIEQSKKILLSPKGTVTEAALASGFSDISYYIKKFTAHNGCTPLQFRNQRINDN